MGKLFLHNISGYSDVSNTALSAFIQVYTFQILHLCPCARSHIATMG